MSVTPAQVRAARPVEVGDDQLDLLAEEHVADQRTGCSCPTPELCDPKPVTCWRT